MSRDFDAVIIGAGVVGTVMASLLASRVSPGSRVAVIDGHATLPSAAVADWDLRVFALGRASQRILEAAGAWERLPTDRRGSYDRMCVWDARGDPRGRGSLCFDCAELGEPDLGHIVDGRALQIACRQSAAARGVVFLDAAVQSVTLGEPAARGRPDERAEPGARGEPPTRGEPTARVGVTDGREFLGRLLIAADGTDSATRRLLGIETRGHAYHQRALVAHLRTEHPHRATAYQRFLATGPLALLPLPDGRSSLVWTVDIAQAERLLALDAAGFGDAVTAASAGVLGACSLATSVASFPLLLQSAERYVLPHVALIGDAAHVVHPLAGQGLNLGLLDCAALCEILEDTPASSMGDLRSLRRYERWRRSENAPAAAALDGVERLFSGGNAALAELRMAALGVVGRLAPLKRELARRALGLSGDVPMLARGTAPRTATR